MNYLGGSLYVPLQELHETSDPLRGEAAYRLSPSVYLNASEKEAREMDHLSPMHRDIRPLSSIAPQKGLLQV